MKEKYIHIVAAIAFCMYLTAIGALCFMHGDSLPAIRGSFFGISADKIVHFLMFCPFIPLSFLTFSKSESSIGRHIILLIILMLIGGMIALSTELIQDKLSYRSYDIKDLIADCIGLAVGHVVIVLWLIIKHLANKH